MPPGFDARLSALAAAQCGAFSRRQVLGLGGSTSLIKRRVRSGVWLTCHPGVYVIAGVPPSWQQQVWTALLAIGPSAAVTHESALRVHGLDDGLVPRYPLTFTIPHGGHARVDGAVVHQIDDLCPSDLTIVDGLPVSRAPRAVVEAAATVGPRRLGNIIDELVVGSRTSHESIAVCLARVARPQKPGVITLARVLDDRGDGYVADQSQLEHELFAALDRAGLPSPRHQAPLPGRGVIKGLVDGAYGDAKLILEADGRRWHTRLRDMKHDHERDAEAARVGWQTLRFLYEQIIGDPDEVCAVVRDVRAVRLGLGSPVPIAPVTAASGEAIGTGRALVRR